MNNTSLNIAAANLVLGLAPVEPLPCVAVQALVEGCDSPALRQLAGLTEYQSEEAPVLFKQALLEVGLSLPDKCAAVFLLARDLAAQILSGQLSPYEGGKRIWQLTLVAGRGAPELDPFIYAASEWEERPEDRPLFEQAIREAATELVGPQG